MADEAKAPPVPSGKDGEGKDKEDAKTMEKSLDARFSRLEGLLEKTAEAIGVLAKRQEMIENRLTKEVPPKSMDAVAGGVDHDPTTKDRQEKNEKSAEGAVKPATSTTETGGAFVKKEDVQVLIAKAIETDVEKRVAALLKGSTPVPGGAGSISPQQEVYDFMRKAVAEDRRICGGGFNTGQGEHFGLRAGTGNQSARQEMARFMTKSAPWNTGFGGK